MKTAMQELKSDLLTAIDTCNEALEEIKDLRTKEACQTVVNLTIDNILNRIDTELLEMEKEQIIDAINFGDERGKITTYSTPEQYYNETFKSK
jgi:molecular chaperone GrpE (heat shock protein)